MPMLAVIAGPRGPSGVTATQSLSFNFFSISAQRRRAASPRRAGDRADPEIGDGVGDDTPVAMRRDQHVHRRHSPPPQRDHHHPAVPEGADERASGGEQSSRPFAVLDRPPVGPVDKADIALDRPARDTPRPPIAQQTPPLASTGQPKPAPLLCRGRRDEVALIGELQRIKPSIQPVAGEQLGVPAALDDAAAIDDMDQIGALHRRQPMGDDQGRAPADQGAQARSEPGARIRCRAPRSPRRAAGSARPSASPGRSRCAGAGRPRAGRRARRPACRSRSAARG